MHPKIHRRRATVLTTQLAEFDRDLKDVCTSLAQRVRLAGSLCLGEEEAKSLERQFQISVDQVLRMPAASEDGRIARRALIQKLVELEKYLESLFHATLAKADLDARPQQELTECRQNLDRIKALEYR